MKTISQKLIIETSNQPHNWLDKVYEEKRTHSLQLVTKAIQALRKEGARLSVTNISKKTKELDPNSKGIHERTIYKNKELYELYKVNSNNESNNKKYNKSKVTKLDNTDFIRVKLDRDITRVREKYNRLTKSELINRIISLETYISQQNDAWLKAQFERLDK